MTRIDAGQCGGGIDVARMFRVLGFFTLVIALMAFAGNMYEFSLTAFFFLLGYLNLTERTYLYTFWAYMLVTFLGLTYWMVFEMKNPV